MKKIDYIFAHYVQGRGRSCPLRMYFVWTIEEGCCAHMYMHFIELALSNNIKKTVTSRYLNLVI